MQMGEIGKLPHGGCCRLALTDDDRRGRDLFVQWCRSAGCTVTVDEIGNIFARREGSEPSLPAVSCGSHLDTQPHGGKFDGIYGVLGGLEVVRALNVHGIKTRRPIDVIVWANEEGSRFPPGLVGSSAFIRSMSTEQVMDLRAKDGGRWGDELKRIGYAGPQRAGDRALDSFFELHIEQGPLLENEEKTIGVVKGIQGIRWFELTVTGQDSHAGTTPLHLRKDALVAAAKMVAEANRIGLAYQPDARVTVGRLDVVPNGPSTIPGSVFFILDTRHPDREVLGHIEREMQDAVAQIARQANVGVQVKPTIDIDPVMFPAECRELVRHSAEHLGYSHKEMLSGAGHDAMNVAQVCPTGMIFVPCRSGLSHNEEEYATPEHLAAGCNVLLHVLVERANTV